MLHCRYLCFITKERNEIHRVSDNLQIKLDDDQKTVHFFFCNAIDGCYQIYGKYMDLLNKYC